MTDNLYISAEEAAAELGVSVNTLYAYVSRKGIRSRKTPGERKRHYWRPDIERVKNGAAPATTSMFDVKQQTQISLLTPAGHYYRGVSALKLADTYTLEQTAAMLWEVDEKVAFGGRKPRTIPEFKTIAYDLMASASTTDKAIALLPMLEHANPQAFDLTHEGLCRTGADVMRWYAALLTGADHVSTEPLHKQVAASLKLSAKEADLLRRLLVLSADHGFAYGTAAVRAIASTGVSPYRSLIAGLAIITGRRSRSGRLEGTGRFLQELLGSQEKVQNIIVRRLREGDLIPGFDAADIYATGDPRAAQLIQTMKGIYGSEKEFKKVLETIQFVHDLNGSHPSFAFAQAVITRRLGVPSTSVLYILGRCAGWIAHAIEQYQAGEISRSAVDYTGALPIASQEY